MTSASPAHFPDLRRHLGAELQRIEAAGLFKRERVITKDELRRATRIWLINSLREWIPATLAE